MLQHHRLTGSLETFVVSSELLKSNRLGDPAERVLPVYLPPGYDEATHRYPVVYVLPAFGSCAVGMVRWDIWEENIIQRFDRLIRSEECAEAILVIVDGSTRFGPALSSSTLTRWAPIRATSWTRSSRQSMLATELLRAPRPGRSWAVLPEASVRYVR